MTTALITTNPIAIVAIYGDNPPRIDPTPTNQVFNPGVPWTSADGRYRLVQVTAFVPPAGQVITGSPSYAVDQNGNVTETYATVAAPAPTVSSLAFMELFTPAESLAIETAAETDPQTALFMHEMAAARSIDLGAAAVTQGLAYLVGKSLITQARATAIAAGQAPS